MTIKIGPVLVITDALSHPLYHCQCGGRVEQTAAKARGCACMRDTDVTRTRRHFPLPTDRHFSIMLDTQI